MDTTSITSALNSSSTGTSTQSGTKTLTEADFMQLFLAQMQYQDPLQPMDNNEVATQLAQFETVDALTTMNSTLS